MDPRIIGLKLIVWGPLPRNMTLGGLGGVTVHSATLVNHYRVLWVSRGFLPGKVWVLEGWKRDTSSLSFACFLWFLEVAWHPLRWYDAVVSKGSPLLVSSLIQSSQMGKQQTADVYRSSQAHLSEESSWLPFLLSANSRFWALEVVLSWVTEAELSLLRLWKTPNSGQSDLAFSCFHFSMWKMWWLSVT